MVWGEFIMNNLNLCSQEKKNQKNQKELDDLLLKAGRQKLIVEFHLR